MGLENVRKRIQKDMPAETRKYLKRSKSILTKPMSKLNDDQKREATLMLEISEDLRLAYGLKESFYREVLIQKNKEQPQYKVNAWIDICKKSKLREFRSYITTFTNWSDEITNSFDYKHSNGALEGNIQILRH
jgi:transposase